MTPTIETLYRAAIQADDQFQAAVVRQFREKEAGDARYRYLEACQEERKRA